MGSIIKWPGLISLQEDIATTKDFINEYQEGKITRDRFRACINAAYQVLVAITCRSLKQYQEWHWPVFFRTGVSPSPRHSRCKGVDMVLKKYFSCARQSSRFSLTCLAAVLQWKNIPTAVHSL
jgi:hypothetical protein